MHGKIAALTRANEHFTFRMCGSTSTSAGHNFRRGMSSGILRDSSLTVETKIASRPNYRARHVHSRGPSKTHQLRTSPKMGRSGQAGVPTPCPLTGRHRSLQEHIKYAAHSYKNSGINPCQSSYTHEKSHVQPILSLCSPSPDIQF